MSQIFEEIDMLLRILMLFNKENAVDLQRMGIVA